MMIGRYTPKACWMMVRAGDEVQRLHFVAVIMPPIVLLRVERVACLLRPNGHHFIAGDKGKTGVIVSVWIGGRDRGAGIAGKTAVDILNTVTNAHFLCPPARGGLPNPPLDLAIQREQKKWNLCPRAVYLRLAG